YLLWQTDKWIKDLHIYMIQFLLFNEIIKMAYICKSWTRMLKNDHHIYQYVIDVPSNECYFTWFATQVSNFQFKYNKSLHINAHWIFESINKKIEWQKLSCLENLFIKNEVDI